MTEASFDEPTTTTESPWDFLAAHLPLADLTDALRQVGADEESHWRDASEDLWGPRSQTSATGRWQPGAEPFEALARAFYSRRTRHVLLTGSKGVGKTTVVRELANRTQVGELPFLSDARFLWIDCRNVGPEDSRACLESILTAAQNEPNVVLCLDGIASLVKRPQGGDNKPLLRAMAAKPNIRILGVLTKWDYSDLFGSDADMLEVFTRIEVEEPDEARALDIARHRAAQFAEEYELQIDDAVVERTVSLCSNYLLSEQHPAKAINILQQACDEADYERGPAGPVCACGSGEDPGCAGDSMADQLGRERTSITVEDVIRVLSHKTGIPHETLAGEAGEIDLQAALTEAVVGQDEAVHAVANELKLIKAGLTDPSKPASVLLFAGMTGVGKTELAKRLAEVYSTSKQLKRFLITLPPCADLPLWQAGSVA